ncbi:MAG: glycosyltransferase family protein [Planctomycetota bacterium]
MTAEGVRFPVAIVHYSAPPVPGEAGRVVAGHARALARAGYPVRLVVGTGAAPYPNVDVRLVPMLSFSHRATTALNSALLRGEDPEGFESRVLDLAQGIGRELVGCGTVFVHDVLTTPWNLAATEALWRLEKGSRGPGIPGSPTRRWVVWANGLAGAGSGPERKKRPWSFMGQPLPGARYVAPSESRRAELAKALGLAKRAIEIVPGGVDVGGSLGLTGNVRLLADEMGLLEADCVILSPSVPEDVDALERGLDIVKAMTRARRGIVVRWIVKGLPYPRDAASAEGAKRLLARRDKLGLADSVRFLAGECEWAREGVAEEDLSALHRLADAVLLMGTDDTSCLSALEGALARNLLVAEPTPALKEIAKGEKGVVLLGARARPAAAAKRILGALASAPAAGLRARARRSLSWDAVARDLLVPLVEGGKIGAKAKRR